MSKINDDWYNDERKCFNLGLYITPNQAEEILRYYGYTEKKESKSRTQMCYSKPDSEFQIYVQIGPVHLGSLMETLCRKAVLAAAEIGARNYKKKLKNKIDDIFQSF